MASQKITRDKKVIVSLPKTNGIYVIDTESVSPNSSLNLAAHSNKSKLWHKRLGHLSEKWLKSLSYQEAFVKGQC